MQRQPSLFLPHGAGPAFITDFGPFNTQMWARTCTYLQGVARSLPQHPVAMVVVSSHWETAVPTVNAAEKPTLYYDYGGGNPASYRLSYPVAGSPVVASRVVQCLADAGLGARVETRRGLDHGVFMPAIVAFPAADVPIVQVSMNVDARPETHLALGRALEPLRSENVLIIGSGMTFHNSAVVPNGLRGVNDVGSDVFDTWLREAVEDPDYRQRNAKLAEWECAPFARHAQPTPDHILPLHVAAGAAGSDRGRHVFSDRFVGATFSAFHFG